MNEGDTLTDAHGVMWVVMDACEGAFTGELVLRVRSVDEIREEARQIEAPEAVA